MSLEIAVTKKEGSEPEEKKYGKFEEYEVEQAARTLEEAEEIKADPELMKYVKMCMEDKVKSVQKAMEGISSIKDLKAVAKKKLEPMD